MLLKHPWLASLSKPTTISEDDEDEEVGITNDPDGNPQPSGENSFDQEVADWVKAAMEKKKAGLMGTSAKPALHAAPFDSISPPAAPSADPLS
jgi:mitogen-activated protein kinase kinase